MLYSIYTNVVIAGLEDPTLREGLREEDVTPGILGFLATFAFVLAAIVVFRIMIRQIRRVKLALQRRKTCVDGTNASVPRIVTLRD